MRRVCRSTMLNRNLLQLGSNVFNKVEKAGGKKCFKFSGESQKWTWYYSLRVHKYLTNVLYKRTEDCYIKVNKIVETKSGVLLALKKTGRILMELTLRMTCSFAWILMNWLTKRLETEADIPQKLHQVTIVI